MLIVAMLSCCNNGEKGVSLLFLVSRKGGEEINVCERFTFHEMEMGKRRQRAVEV